MSIIYVNCCDCGSRIYMEESLHSDLKADPDRWFHCLNGHRQHFTTPAWKRDIERLERERNQAQRERDDARAKLAQIERDRAGKCPHCNRVFYGKRGLQSHLARAHRRAAA